MGQKNHRLSLHTKGRALETFDPRGSSERSAQGHGGPTAPGGEPPAHPAGRRGVRCRPDVTCGRVLGLRTALSPPKMGRKFGGLGLLKFLKNIPGMGLPGSDLALLPWKRRTTNGIPVINLQKMETLQKGLARLSSEPPKREQLHHFDIGLKAWMMEDTHPLPHVCESQCQRCMSALLTWS